MTEIVGFLAGVFVATSSLPQIIKSWKTKSTKDLSFGLMGLNLIGQILWTVYGVLVGSPALIVMSSVTIVFVVSLLFLKFRYS
ncbi:MAG: SemiSWEET family transporter [bacterium]